MTSRTVEAFRAALPAMEDGHDLKPWTEEDGLSSCPCFWITLDGFKAHGHCWRTTLDGFLGGCSCEYVGLHVWGDPAIGARLKVLLDAMDWYGEWPLVLESVSGLGVA